MLYHPNDIPDEAVEALRPAYERSSKLYGTPELWIQRCREGTAQLWRSEDGKYWAVTEVYEGTAYGKLLHGLASSGEFCEELVQEGEAWAKEQGCKAAMTGGRRGWEKLFSTMGYKTVAVMLLKEF